MKIGIMTLWGAFDNYGQQFQVFALQHFLRKRGHDAFIIRYEYKKDVRKKKWYEHFYTIKYLFDCEFIKSKVQKFFNKVDEKSINRGFSEFADKYIIFSENLYHNFNDLQKNPPEADIYIVGSDQVWNYSSQYKPYSNKIRAFFLDFGKEHIKKIGYAVSFGRDKYGKYLQRFVKPLLEKFDYISCRENQGIKILNSMNIKSSLCLDPVFLNSKNEYLGLIKNQETLENEKFILLYLLGNSTKVDFDKIDEFAKEQNCKIIFIPGKGLKQNRYKEHFPNPVQWLWYMNNAKFIITNSFHGTAFSIILNKNFCVLPLSGKNSLKQNDRLFSMFELLEIDKKFIGFNKENLIQKINWEKINQNIKSKNQQIDLLKIIQGENL